MDMLTVPLIKLNGLNDCQVEAAQLYDTVNVEQTKHVDYFQQSEQFY